jgi:UDP-3-O-[3-hydroxymyristoyl] N-acetylglucosamine deacetylase
LLDGSAQEWVEAIQSAGLCAAEDTSGHKLEKLAPEIHDPVYLRIDDCFVAAFPSSQIHITYGIDFPKARLLCPLCLPKSGNSDSFYLFICFVQIT